ncbi:globin [Paenibacillus sambharensis]|uniref:Globin n=1 Tax=Paenibacillus sambharensis TaxID=1803190 RepID=A0A2W1LIR7_9BACL|nr:globin [Paenibacillus sambharensis]PZD94962.1 globin [Paenibacillus sambharensis]
MSASHTLFDAIGGEPAVRAIVEAFYPKVQEHELLSPLFPEDITPVMEKQFLFLTQFFGGPQLYSDQYGHPMMRARHMPFPIDKQRAEAWLDCMRRALQETDIPPELQAMLLERLSGPAHHFINTDQHEEA